MHGGASEILHVVFGRPARHSSAELAEVTLRRSEVLSHLARFSEIEKSLIERYGETSQARVLFLYEQLVTLRLGMGETAPEAVPLVVERLGRLRRDIQDLYDLDSFPADVPTPVTHPVDAPGVIEYDGTVFARRYAEAAALIRHEVVRLEDWRPEVNPRPVGYMYVVDDTGALRVWDHPFTLSQMLLGRDRMRVGGWTVGHPMLVPERRRVRAAGEIMPITDGRTGRLRGVVANLKSGHFRPPPSAADAVRAACLDQAGVAAAECDVFTIPTAEDRACARTPRGTD